MQRSQAFFKKYLKTNVEALKLKPIIIDLRNTFSVEEHKYGRQSLPLNEYKELYRPLNTAKPPQDYGLSLFQSSDNSVNGTLTENNKPVPNVLVFIYQASTGVFVARTVTDLDGHFVFHSLLSDIRYYIVASDPKGVYNTVTLDGIRIDSRKEYVVDVG